MRQRLRLMSDRLQTAVFLIAMFLLCLLGWGPLSEEIHAQAIGEVTNTLWVLLDSVFPLFWGFMTISMVGLAMWTIVREYD